MKPHKHAELIKAWADGAEIEERWKIEVDFCNSEWSKWAMFDGVWTEEDYWVEDTEALTDAKI